MSGVGLQGSGAEYGVVVCDAGVVALASARAGPPLHPSDLLLLVTFVRSNESLRQVLCSTHHLREFTCWQ